MAVIGTQRSREPKNGGVSHVVLTASLMGIVLCFVPSITDAKLVPGFRPRATPLFVLNPAMAFWLKSDNLTDVTPEMWYHQSMTMTGYIRIDGKTHRWLGVDGVNGATANVTETPPLPQVDLAVTPTRTIATFLGGGIRLTATFWQPAFADDLEHYARQYAYITTSVASHDGGDHKVELYIDHAADVPVNQLGDQFVWADWSHGMKTLHPSAVVLQMNDWQAVSFQLRGDANKPNWGDCLLATASPLLSGYTQANATDSRNAFIQGHQSPPSETLPPRSANDKWLVSSMTFNYGTVTPAKRVSSFVVFLHNEEHSVAYFHKYQAPYWKHLFGGWRHMLNAALKDHDTTLKRAIKYDRHIITKMTEIAGDEYATLTSLIHRQVMGATLLTWNEQHKRVDGWMKEQSTDGDLSTVDVIFPSSPFFVYLAPEALRVILLPLLDYANNATYIKYNRPFAPHHLGAWPVGDIKTVDQEEMPMEETGNMLIMLAAIAQQQHGKVAYLKPYHPLLLTWANYLNASLPDPMDQTCTDDFEGHIPHNANLAIKGIVGISAYAILLEYMGHKTEAQQWQTQAENLAQRWMALAADPVTNNTLPHFKLRYDVNDTWSLKYNLMYQYGLGVDTFSPVVREEESAFYQTKANKFGIPLDNRHSYSLTEWLAVGAALGNAGQRDAILGYLYNFAATSPTREPFMDCYETTTNVGNWGLGRPVLGAMYSVAVVDRMNTQRGISFD